MAGAYCFTLFYLPPRNDGAPIYTKQIASISAGVQKSKADQMLLIGRGKMKIAIVRGLRQALFIKTASENPVLWTRIKGLSAKGRKK